MAIQTWTIQEVKSGDIKLFTGLRANIPAGWHECDGTNGTPDFRTYHVKGASAVQEANVVLGAAAHNHAVGTTVVTPTTHSSQGGHTHDAHTTSNRGTGSGAAFTAPATHSNQGAHNHDNHGLTWGPADGSSEPLTKTVIWIMKL